MKKAISFILSAVIAVSVAGTSVFADEVSNDGKYTMPESGSVTNGASEQTDNMDVSESVMNKNNGSEFVLPEDENTEDKKSDDDTNNSNTLSGAYKSNKLTVNLRMLPRMLVKDSFAVLEICDKNEKVITEKSQWVGGITQNLTYEFDVPEYSLGETFILKLKRGLSGIKYYEDYYYYEEPVLLNTYVYTDEYNNVIEGNVFELDALPEFKHAIVVYYDGKQINLSPRARLIDGTAMVPVRAVAEEMGIDVKYDAKYQSVVCSVGGLQAIFNIGTDYATFFGEDLTLPHKCEKIDSTVFVPVRSLAEAFGAEVNALDFGDHIDVCIGLASKVIDMIPVNKWGISSRTGYLVWIDKSDYRVRVYTGSQYKWKQAASFPCAIGAPSTPTITGSYEYQYKVSSWDYPGYYVGPCLVFYGGYALHSTLLRYDGVPYDNRVETMISHGCIRLHKSDIDWIASRLPIGSRIYITE